MPRVVLIVGATGILAPAVRTLLDRGDEVIAVARDASAAAGATTRSVDATEVAALGTALDGLRWDDAIVYGPAVSMESLAFVRTATPGRRVVVRTSAAADPALGILVVPHDTLQLGWREDHAATDRWHTPAEVSAAALAVLGDGEPRVLGTVRPWSDRP